MWNKDRKKNDLVVGLDIGSSLVRVAVGQVVNSTNGPNKLQIIGLSEAPSEGIHKGNVTSIEEVVSSISHALEQAERLVGVPVENVWVGINGTQIIVQESKGVVAVAKSDGEIGPEDVDRTVGAARMVAAPLNYDILHVLPKKFAVDGQTGIKDPVGMTGIRLEVDTQMIYGLTSHIKSVTKAVYRTGIDIDDLVLSIFAVGEVVTTSRQKDLGVAVVNIGSSTTGIVVYEEGEILHTAVLPIGSEHITNDLAIGLRTSIDIAEKIKIAFGECVKTKLNKKDKINLIDIGAEEDEEISKEYVIDIINARVSEILEKVDKELSKIDRSGRLPAGVVFTGGGSKINGLVELSKEVLCLPASLGYPIDIQSVTEKSSDMSYSTAVGLVEWGANLSNFSNSRRPVFIKQTGKFIEKFQKLFKSLMP